MEDYKKYEDLAEILKVISHPIRITILAGLLQRKSCVKDIWDCLGLPQATVSQHLAILKNKHIIKAEKKGVKREYYVSNPKVAELIKAMINIFGTTN